MAKPQFSIADIRLWLEADGADVDISSLQLTYALNSIPRATLVLAAGVRAKTGRISPAFALAENSGMVEGKIFLQGAQGAASELNTLTVNGRYTLFEGYVTGINGAVGGGLRLQAEMTHWLSDLNYSSAISAQSSPENPWQFTFNAAVPGASDTTRAGGGFHFLPITKAQSIITEKSVQDDLWGEGILPWFKDLAASDRINLPEFGRNDTADKTVQTALNRFDGEKLPLQVAGIDYAAVAKAIAEDIAVTSLDPSANTNHLLGMANTTLWDKLVGELSPLYRFAVVPLPTSAKVIPFVAGLRSDWRPRGGPVTMLNRDENSIDIASRLLRPLGGVGIYCSYNGAAGGLGPTNSTPAGIHIGGKFVAGEEGMILTKRAPRWMDQIPLPTVTTAGPLTGDPVADAMAPAAGEAPSADKPADKVKETKVLFDKFAQSLYIDEVLQHRTGQIVCPLRFDICPGSTIAFQGHNASSKRGLRYGSVIAVSYMIDAEQRTAHTIYTIGHIRTEKENGQDAFSIDRHPLYDNVWKGGHLVEPS